jgi:hypothetical protein
MTTGTKVIDGQGLVEEYSTVYPSGVKTSRGFKPVGSYWSKTWSGTNYPPNKPTFEKIYWRDPYKGKLHTYKRRLDKPVRTKTDYHPYSCTIIGRNSGWFQIDRYAYGQLDSITVTTTLGAFGDGYSYVGGNEWGANDDLALINQLREKIVGSDFNLGVFLGESHEMLTLIGGSATRIFQSLRYLKRGNIVGAAHALGAKPPKGHFTPKGVRTDMANAWLELQYGWLPLLKDAKSAAEMLAKQLEFPLVATYRVKRRKAVPLSAVSSAFTGSAGYRETRGQLIARVSEGNVAQLVGLLDPASVAWELLPWSFVADWFMPIGDYLSARSFVNSITGEFVTTKTTRTEFAYSCLKTVNSPPIKELLTQPGSHYSTRVEVNRSVSTSLQVPFPSFKTLDKALSWRHCANAIALLTQLGSSGRSPKTPMVPWTPFQQASKVL